MNRVCGTAFALFLVASVSVVGLGTAPSWARQGSGSGVRDEVAGRVIPEFSAHQVEIRAALRDLFKRVGVSYTLSPSVQGNVTANLKNASFYVVLRALLEQVDANYVVEGGVYMITPRPAYDLVTAVPSSMPITLRDISIEEFLRRIKGAGMDYRIEGGEYTLFGSRQEAKKPFTPLIRDPSVIHMVTQQEGKAGETTITQDGKHLFILRGNELIKVDKSSLKVLQRTRI